MNSRHLRAVVEFPGCFLSRLARKEVNVRVRVLRVQEEDEQLRVWILVKGSKRDVREFLRGLSSEKGATFTILHNSGSVKLLHVAMPAGKCSRREHCPIACPSPKSYALNVYVERGRSLAVVVVSSKKALQELSRLGFRVLEQEDGAIYEDLTPQQEAILLIAYELGYYNYPRRANLRDIAEATGLSVSTVAERLRKAEAKIIGRLVREELVLLKYKDNEDEGTDEQGAC